MRAFTAAFGFFLLLIGSPKAHAWQLLPETRHHLFQSYASFIEHHNIVAFRGASRYWAAAAITLPVFGDNESPLHPQVLFHMSANDSMHVNAGGGVFTETLDTRIGLYYEMALPWWELRFTGSLNHQSGHTVDGTDDPALGPLNLGDNYLILRVLRDFAQRVRVGLNVNPVLHAIPDNYWATMGETADWFPLGSAEDTARPSPFVSLGLSQRADFNGMVNVHAQAGASFGKFFSETHSHLFRLAIGYYNGVDPRAKYSQYEGKRESFGYLAAMFNL